MASTTVIKYADGVFGTNNVAVEKFTGNNRATITGDSITIKTDTGLVLFNNVPIGGGDPDRLLINDQTTATNYDPSTPLAAISTLSSIGFFADAPSSTFSLAGATDTSFSGLATNDITQYNGTTWANISFPITSGTWTPEFLDVGGAATYTINNVLNASYYRLGRLVFANLSVSDVDTDVTATGTFTIRGLPFTVSEDAAADIFVFSGGDVTFFSVIGRLTNIAGVAEIRLAMQSSLDTTLTTVTALTLTNALLRLSTTYIISN